MPQIILAFVAALAAIGVGVGLYRSVLAAPTSNDRANEIAAAIRAGAEAFLNRQYRTVAMVGVPILVLIGLLLNWWYAFGFLLGAVASAAAGFIGMNVSVRANVRVAEAAHSGFRRAFDLSFQGGTVTGRPSDCRKAATTLSFPATPPWKKMFLPIGRLPTTRLV